MRISHSVIILAVCAICLSGRSAAASPATPASGAVPFVGCPSDGQLGPQPAPRKLAHVPVTPQSTTGKLAYYSSRDLGVLGPRGWHCVGLYGSNGSILIVTPEIHTANELLSSTGSSLKGPAIQLTFSFGGTSGRFLVAEVAARLFPSKKAFVQRVIDEKTAPKSDFPWGPFSTDVLKRRGATDVEFETPGNQVGMGTKSRLLKNGRPISGVAIMTGDNNLMLLDVRVSPDLAYLIPSIIDAVRTSYSFRTGRQ